MKLFPDLHIIPILRKVIVITLLFFFMPSTQINAQSSNSNQEVAVEQFDKRQWKELKDETNYWRKKKKKKEKEEEQMELPPNRGMGEISLGPLMYVFIALAIALLVYVLLRVFAAELFTNSTKLKKDISFSLDEIEDNLEEAPLQKFLREAMESGNYKLAIRVYYLSILQGLNENKQIHWRKEKTNNHYVSEMRPHTKFKDFRSITRIFEKIWYGPLDEISLQEFEFVQPAFQDFIKAIK